MHISGFTVLNRVQSEIENAYKERLNAEENGDLTDPEADPEQVVNEILQKYKAPWLAAMISSNQMLSLVEQAEEKAAMFNKETQVERETETVATSTSPTLQKDKETFTQLSTNDLRKVSMDDVGKTPIRINKLVHFSTILVQHFEIQPKQRHFDETPVQTEPNVMKHEAVLCNLKPAVQSVTIQCHEIPLMRQESAEIENRKEHRIEQKNKECQVSRATKENSSQTRQSGSEKQIDNQSDAKQSRGGRWRL